MRKSLKVLRLTIAITAITAMAGCVAVGREFVDLSAVGKLPSQTAPKMMSQSGLTEDVGEAVSAIQVDETAFMVRPIKAQNVNLPDFYVKNISATESGVKDALQIMLEGSGLALNIEGGPRAMERFGASSIQNVRGGLRKVLDTLSDQIGFFWSTNNGILTIEPDRLFVVQLPPVLGEESLVSMSNTMQYLGARDAYLDQMARTIVFRANRKTLKVIDEYLVGVRATRSMLIYEIQVYQVDLADGNEQGVNWSGLTRSSLDRASSSSKNLNDLGKSFALTSNGTGLGAVLMGPNFSVNALVNFLKTQGTVKTVSQPRLAMLNGAKGLLRVGEITTYVSKIGSNNSSGVSQVMVETKDLHTGLELGITGEEHDNTVTTRVSLQLSELVRFNKYTTLGTDLSLPDVTNRELNTAIKLPAGYTALLGGITVARESDERKSGILADGKVQLVKRSELVMVIKPTIVRFKNRQTSNMEASASTNTLTNPEVPVVPVSFKPVALVPAALVPVAPSVSALPKKQAILTPASASVSVAATSSQPAAPASVYPTVSTFVPKKPPADVSPVRFEAVHRPAQIYTPK